MSGRPWRLLMLAAAAGGDLAAQATWFLPRREAGLRIVGAAASTRPGPGDGPLTLPAGEYSVHFGSDARGKPMSLAFAVPDRAVVRLGVEPATAAETRKVPLDGDGWAEAKGGAGEPAGAAARCTGEPEAAAYRVEATLAADAGAGSAGIVARWQDAEHHYRFVWDRERAELRIERRLGGDLMVLARCAAPPPDEQDHGLCLQVEGFRLEAFWDDAPVLQAFDGALESGLFGTWSAGAPVVWRSLAVEPPARPSGSSALVCIADRAWYHAATTVLPGHHHVLELALDRPGPPLPLAPAGLESSLLLPPAAPQVLLADWRGAPGPGCLGEVPREGAFAGEIRWPSVPGLAGQVVLVRALLVAPDGEAVVAATPPAALRL